MWPWSKQESVNGDENSVLRLKLLGAENEMAAMRKMIGEQETKLRKYQEREYIDFELGDPVPTDKEKRQAYVSAVAGLYHEVLHPKFRLMIATSRALLENPDNTRETDLEMKGTIYALWELIRWGNLMVGEDKANMRGEDPSNPEDKNNK